MAHYFGRSNFSSKLEHVFCGHIAFVHDGMGKIHIFPKLLCIDLIIFFCLLLEKQMKVSNRKCKDKKSTKKCKKLKKKGKCKKKRVWKKCLQTCDKCPGT